MLLIVITNEQGHKWLHMYRISLDNSVKQTAIAAHLEGVWIKIQGFCGVVQNLQFTVKLMRHGMKQKHIANTQKLKPANRKCF